MERQTQCRGKGAWPRKAGWLLVLFVAWSWALPAAAATQREYELKAAVLYHIIEYVSWPAEVAAERTPVLDVGLLGSIPFPAALEVLNGKTINGRRLNVRRLSNLAEAATCHVLFVGSVEKERLREILDLVNKRPVLTVSEYEGFTEQGGMVALIPRQNRIQPEINREAARRVRLDFSSQLLNLAKVVGPAGG